MVLNESNDLWVEFRHAHIGLVLRELSSRYNDLIKNFKGASELVQGKGESMGLEEMRKATQGLPEFQVCYSYWYFVYMCVIYPLVMSTYTSLAAACLLLQELSRQISHNIKLAGLCSDKVTELKLLDVGALEQAMALGTTEVNERCHACLSVHHHQRMYNSKWYNMYVFILHNTHPQFIYAL